MGAEFNHLIFTSLACMVLNGSDEKLDTNEQIKGGVMQ